MPGLSRVYDRLEEGVCVFFFVLIFLLMVLGVGGRYFLDVSFEWNIELCCYSFVWLTFLGSAFVQRRFGHITIDIAHAAKVARLPPGGRRTLYALREALLLFFLGALIVLGVQLALRSWRFMSQAMQISQFFLYISVPVGAAMFLIREIQRIRESRVGARPERAAAPSPDGS